MTPRDHQLINELAELRHRVHAAQDRVRRATRRLIRCGGEEVAHERVREAENQLAIASVALGAFLTQLEIKP